MNFTVTTHALNAFRERFPAFATGRDEMDSRFISDDAASSLPLGCQVGDAGLLMSQNHKDMVFATKPHISGNGSTAIVTVLTYDMAMANSQVTPNRYRKRKSGKTTKRSKGHRQ